MGNYVKSAETKENSALPNSFPPPYPQKPWMPFLLSAMR